jgi:hypothetical protein
MANNWTLTRDQISTEALKMLGELAEGETASSAQLATCSTVLNMLLKELSWEGCGVKSKSVQDITPTGYASDGSFSVSAAPWDVLDSFYRYSGNDYPVQLIGRETYNSIQNKTAVGPPLQLFFNHADSKGYIYPIPPDVTNYKLYASLNLPLENMDTSSGSASAVIDSGGIGMLVAGLAYKRGFMNGMPQGMLGMYRDEFMRTKDSYRSKDIDINVTHLRPSMRVV